MAPEVTPVFTQKVQAGSASVFSASGTDPVVAIPWSFYGPLGTEAFMSVRLEGAGIVQGSTYVCKVYYAYGVDPADIPPSYQELLGTKTGFFNASNESNGAASIVFFPGDVTLPTSYTDPFAVLSPYPDPTFGDFGITFETTVTTPNQGLYSTVTAFTTTYGTGANANEFITIWGDFPITVGGTAITSQSPGPNQISSSGGTITVAHALNSTAVFDGNTQNAGSMHRKVELINSNGIDIFGAGSSVSGQSVNYNNLSTASASFNAFNVGDVFTLKVTLGSGAWNSPTDDFRLVRYQQDFTVV